MASFCYYDQNPSVFAFLCKLGLFLFKLAESSPSGWSREQGNRVEASEKEKREAEGKLGRRRERREGRERRAPLLLAFPQFPSLSLVLPSLDSPNCRWTSRSLGLLELLKSQLKRFFASLPPPSPQDFYTNQWSYKVDFTGKTFLTHAYVQCLHILYRGTQRGYSSKPLNIALFNVF